MRFGRGMQLLATAAILATLCALVVSLMPRLKFSDAPESVATSSLVRPLSLPYPTTSRFIADIPASEDEPVRVELVGFSEQGNPNYLFGNPGHWNRVFIDGREITGYDTITFQGSHILLRRKGQARVVINWKLQPAYDEITWFDGIFMANSGTHWAYGAVKLGRGYIISDRSTIELEEGWRMLHLPTFDASGDIAYVITKTSDNLPSRVVYKKNVFEHDLISPVKIIGGKLIYSYLNIKTPDTLHLAIDGETVAKSERNDPASLGYGISLGDSGFFIVGDSILFNGNAYDLTGKQLDAGVAAKLLEMPVREEHFAEKMGTITTVEGEKTVFTQGGSPYWYSSAERRTYPAAISQTGKQAYANPARQPLESADGYSLSFSVETSESSLKGFSQVRHLEFLGDKLLIVGAKGKDEYVQIGDKIFGPYRGSYYDSVILPIHTWEDKLGFAYESAGKLHWEVVPTK